MTVLNLTRIAQWEYAEGLLVGFDQCLKVGGGLIAVVVSWFEPLWSRGEALGWPADRFRFGRSGYRSRCSFVESCSSCRIHSLWVHADSDLLTVTAGLFLGNE